MAPQLIDVNAAQPISSQQRHSSPVPSTTISGKVFTWSSYFTWTVFIPNTWSLSPEYVLNRISECSRGTSGNVFLPRPVIPTLQCLTQFARFFFLQFPGSPHIQLEFYWLVELSRYSKGVIPHRPLPPVPTH